MIKYPIVCYSQFGDIRIDDYHHEKYFSIKEASERLTKLSESNQNFIFRINFEFFKQFSLRPTGEKLYELPILDVYLFSEFKKLDFKNKPIKFKLKSLNSLVSTDEATAHLNTIKEKINTGHFYQVNYSIPFKGKIFNDVDLFELFSSLRPSFSGNYHAFLPLSNASALLSYSPELLFHLKDKKLTTEPIKGTIVSGSESKLLSSEKENSELSMIVDLLRNDLNSISKTGATVESHRELLHLHHLTHTFSRVSTMTDLSLGEILEKLLPGGSISGCPKKESVKTILELEPFQREFYTGVIGIRLSDTVMSSIVIRSLLAYENGDFFYHSGAGIVESSMPEDEIDEIYLKAKSIMNNEAWEHLST